MTLEYRQNSAGFLCHAAPVLAATCVPRRPSGSAGGRRKHCGTKNIAIGGDALLRITAPEASSVRIGLTIDGRSAPAVIKSRDSAFITPIPIETGRRHYDNATANGARSCGTCPRRQGAPTG